MQASSSPSSSPALASEHAKSVAKDDRKNYVTVLDDDASTPNKSSSAPRSPHEGQESRIHKNKSNEISFSPHEKQRRHSGSNGSSAGSPLTPSTCGSGPEESPSPQHQQQQPHQGQGDGITATASASSLTTSGQLDGQPVLQTAAERAPQSSARQHVLRVDPVMAEAAADIAAGTAAPRRRVLHTLRLQPPSVNAEQPPPQEEASVEGAPPTKRLRLSLTPIVAQTASTTESTAPHVAPSPNTGSSGDTGCVGVSGNGSGSGGASGDASALRRGRVLRLIPPVAPTPAAASAITVDIAPTEEKAVQTAPPPHAVEVADAQRASPSAEDIMREEQALAHEQAMEAPTLQAPPATTPTLAAVQAEDAKEDEIASPSLVGAAGSPNGIFSPFGVPGSFPAQSPLTGHQQRRQEQEQQQQQQQKDEEAPPQSFPASAAGAAVRTGNAESPLTAPPRLRSLTPQPYNGPTPTGGGGGGSPQGSPQRRRHRFVSVNLPSAPPPPQRELFTTFQRTVRDVYEVQERLSEGTYGEVFKGVDKRTGAVVALKRLKVLSTHQGFPQTSLREVIALRHIQRQRERLEARQREQQQPQQHGGSGTAVVADPLAEIAQLCDVLIFDRQQPDIVLVFAYASSSLAGLLRRQFIFSPSELAYLIKKLLTAVRKLHAMSIIHRDIKSDNVLITAEGEVQLTDFGLCSIISSSGSGSSGGGGRAWRTPSVITLAYRPPEMLLGSTAYDEKVDVWSVGCLLAQLFLFEPPFYRYRVLQQQQQQQPQAQRTAATELEQLSRITEVLGPLPPARVFHPDACQHMRVLEQLEQQGRLAEAGKAAQPPNWGKLQSLFEPSFLYQQFHGFRGWFEAEMQRARTPHPHHPPPRRPSQACMDVLCAALQLDPHQRPSAAELLRMPYFTTLDDAPLLGSFHRPLTPATAEREEEVRLGFMVKVQRCGDSHSQRRPH